MPTFALITSAPSSDAAYRTDLIRRFLAASDDVTQLELLAEAARYDEVNPGESLLDELYGSALPAAA
jgi:hypothetical protein